MKIKPTLLTEDFFGGVVPPVTDDLPDELAVLLFNVGIVVLFVGPTACKNYLSLLAELLQQGI